MCIEAARQLAERLDGRQYPGAVLLEDSDFAKQHNLVIIHAHSDDLIISDGVVSDEHYESLQFINGQLIDPPCNRSGGCCCYKQSQSCVTHTISGELTDYWKFETNINPVFRFRIYEDEELYAEGFVFSLNSLLP